MNTHTKLTVIILTYNSQQSIRSCLQSLVNQTFTDFRVLIIDDVSEDKTMAIVAEFTKYLAITSLANGAHSIPRGRNIGLSAANTPYVAFLDSDDTASRNWTNVIITTLSKTDRATMISGDILPAWRTRFAQACACNDSAIRKLFSNGAFMFSTCNCAFSEEIGHEFHFDEGFRYHEDMEWLSRIVTVYPWEYVESMKIHHESRNSISSYARQMYSYGMWRLFYSVRTSNYRLVDFVPLSIILVSFVLAVVVKSVIPLGGIIAFCVAESVVVSIYERCNLLVSCLTIVAWMTKNVAWSVGVCVGIVRFGVQPGLRRWLKDGTRV